MNKRISMIVRTVRPWTPHLIFAGVLAAVVGFADQFVPVKVRALVDSAMNYRTSHSFDSGAAIALVCLLVVTQLLRIGQRLVTEWASTRIGARLLEQGVLHLLSHTMDWFSRNHSGALQVRLDRSTRAIAELLKTLLSEILSPTIGVVTAAVLMLQADLTAGLIAVATIPILATLTMLQARSQAGIRVSINRGREEQGVRIIEAAEGVEQVKIFAAESSEAQRAGVVARDLSDKEYRHHVAMARFDLFKFWAERAGFFAVLVSALAATHRTGGSLGLGGVMMLMMLFDRIAEPVRHLHRIIDEVNEKWVLARDYVELLSNDAAHRATATVRGGDVEFGRVTFAYPGAEKPVLTDVTFHLPAGSKAALVGPSGCGKSTVAKLIAGFYRPSDGHVCIGGQEVGPIESINASVGVMSQEPYIFQGTIQENIQYGRPAATDEQVREAARIAGIADYIESLPDCYQTQVGQRGSGLSGGQKQRIALARVILQDPSLIVFDEPSSSLDPINAQRLFEVVMSVFADRTMLVITHDWSNLDWADRVVELDRGRVKWDGGMDQFRVRQGLQPDESCLPRELSCTS